MPKYIYRCPACDKKTEISHSMNEDFSVCKTCGGKQHRVPQPFLVNWNGLPPSVGESPQAVQDHLRNRERNLDDYYQRKEERERGP